MSAFLPDLRRILGVYISILVGFMHCYVKIYFLVIVLNKIADTMKFL